MEDIMQTIRKRYIRFGDIPENEVSCVWRDTIKVSEEKGEGNENSLRISEIGGKRQ